MRFFTEDRDSFVIDQSIRDAPCRVRFAGRDALVSLSRWGGDATLAFAPGAAHESSARVRGNEIILSSEATPKRHEVFRRLDGERFEYDVVLLAEPETNLIEIALDYPEGLEFFRQPSALALASSPFRCPPEVAESYAVYWKERNGPHKTGKFCHIYRPEIRDARGRKVWGTLNIAGHRMTITIPEDWLSDAAYPVVVDPIVGTATRGALRAIDWYGEDDPRNFSLETQVGLNRFTAPALLRGTCTSYVYSCSSLSDSWGQAVVYSNDEPAIRISENEEMANFTRSTPEWVPSNFTLSRTIEAGETFWYGYSALWLETYYDVGGLFLWQWIEEDEIPETVVTSGVDSWSLIMSMYFEYSTSQNFSRVISGACAVAGNAASARDLLRVVTSVLAAGEGLQLVKAVRRLCASGLGVIEALRKRVGLSRKVASGFSFIETIKGKMILKKEELIIVSRVTKEIELSGRLV